MASATSTTYDTAVSFTAEVSTVDDGSAVPSGTVTFEDASNGSILDAVALQDGTAAFTTAALAPGTRQIEAVFSGTGFPDSTSPVVPVTVQAADDSTAANVDAMHDGYQPLLSFGPSTAAERWSVTPGVPTAKVSNVLAAGGQVFLTEASAGSGSTDIITIYALDAETGATTWFASVSSLYGEFGMTYDGGTLFGLTEGGLLTAYDAADGKELWSEQLPDQSEFDTPPTAYDGMVFVSGAGEGGTVYGLSEADGTVDWAESVNGGDTAPAVDDNGVFVGDGCEQDYGFTLGGTVLWQDAGDCSGGVGSNVALHGSSVYVDDPDASQILSAASGAQIGTFAAQGTPSFDASTLYAELGGNLVAVDPSGSPDLWQFGNGTLVTPPLATGSLEFVGASNGTVYGVSTTGTQVWSASAGADITAGQALASGDGLLIVPAGGTLTAFGS